MENYTLMEERALHICIEAHEGDFRRDGKTPYSTHPRQVADKAKTEDERIVALLHDVVEDTSWTLQDLTEADFSSRITDAVDAITKRKGEETQEEYWGRVMNNDLALRVKIYDMITNLSDNPTVKQINKYTEGLNKLLKHKLYLDTINAKG